jgi:long-chain acyl-CoA synthetase
VALRAKRAGRWVDIGYRELAERVQDLSVGLLELGLRRGDRVAILSENRPEWAITDYACLAARCADVPIYPTLPARQAEYILRDSGAVAVLVSNAGQLQKVLAVRDRLPALANIIAFEEAAAGPGVLRFEQVLERGRAARERHPAWRAAALEAAPDDPPL